MELTTAKCNTDQHGSIMSRMIHVSTVNCNSTKSLRATEEGGMRRCTDGGLGFHPARTDDGDGCRNPELGGRRWRADVGGGAAPFLPVVSAADSVPSRRERRRRGSRSRTREVGNADPGENGGFGSGCLRGWASKQHVILARVRFPRGRPTRGKGRDPRRESGSQTRPR